ncbi:MAG TPA: ATP-binding protein [Thermoanaerobaculia bacterium]|nr:ATP-binding protein [Thermoanaerobaculia bacterium]
MTVRRLLDYRKDPRIIITLPLLILVVASLVFYLVQRAKELSPEAMSSRLLLFVLWNINLILILGIAFVLLRGMVKLVIDRQRGRPGSRFRTKLVITYVATSLFPILLLFFIATDLLRVSVDRWFNTPVRTLVQNSDQIAQISQDQSIARVERAAREVAWEIERRDGAGIDEALNHVRHFHQMDLVGLYERGAVVKLIADPRAPINEVGEPSRRFFDEIRARGSARKIDVIPTGKWIRYGVRMGDGSDRELVALGGTFIPAAVSRLLDQNTIAYQNFRQLDAGRPALKASQTLLFLAVTLSILFSTLWTSIYVSRRITTPIEALAEGTRTLAEGRFDHRIGVRGTDEFATLIDSFNNMSSQLQTNRETLTRTNVELTDAARRLDEERAYLSAVQESVSTGIMTLNNRSELLSINHSAQTMLHVGSDQIGKHVDAVFAGDLEELGEYLRDITERDPRPREITLTRSGELRYLELSAARLPVGGGWVVALEDSTQLIQAQKLAAWSEAARRIAHEIKNPLTPIQLSAERIARKFRQGDPGIAQAVDEGCKTIVNEVGQLKRMVDEFSRFARLPAVHLRQSSVAEILEGVVRLYRDSKPGVDVTLEVDPTLQALLDPEQIRRVLINLLDNALEATDSGFIRLRAEKIHHDLRISVEDSGRGVSDRDKENLFLPNFSTKGRGTGLGLAIVHRIVKDHDGRISIHDNRPRGTRFEIDIPA